MITDILHNHDDKFNKTCIVNMFYGNITLICTDFFFSFQFNSLFDVVFRKANSVDKIIQYYNSKEKKIQQQKIYGFFLQFNMTFRCITLLWWCIEKKNEIKNPHLISIQLE